MYRAKLIVNKDFQKTEISPLIYGSFVEHMGRVVYNGIYEKEHEQAQSTLLLFHIPCLLPSPLSRQEFTP